MTNRGVKNGFGFHCLVCAEQVEEINIGISGFMKFEATDKWDYWCPKCEKEFDRFTVEVESPDNKQFYLQYPWLFPNDRVRPKWLLN